MSITDGAPKPKRRARGALTEVICSCYDKNPMRTSGQISYRLSASVTGREVSSAYVRMILARNGRRLARTTKLEWKLK